MLQDVRYSLRALAKRPSCCARGSPDRPETLLSPKPQTPKPQTQAPSPNMARHTIFAALLIAVQIVPRPHAAERTPSVKDVMRRVADYVATYGEKASILVGTERYTQETDGRMPGAQRVRVTVAEFAIVKVETIRGWLGFRDVVEVDGRSIADREDRLVRLLTSPGNRYDEARQLTAESARFNIGRVERNFNVPTTVLFYFTRDNQERFKFTAKGVQADGSWEIAFRETQHPTLIRTPEGKSVPSDGSIWVNPADGTIVRTMLKVGGIGIGAPKGTRGAGTIVVTYRRVEPLEMWLPESMVEQFEINDRQTWETITGRATYTNYRRFQTAVRIR